MSLEEKVKLSSCSKPHVKKVNRTKKRRLNKQEEFKFIDEYASMFFVELLLRLTTVSRSGYYTQRNSKSKQTQNRDELLYHLILEVFEGINKNLWFYPY